MGYPVHSSFPIHNIAELMLAALLKLSVECKTAGSSEERKVALASALDCTRIILHYQREDRHFVSVERDVNRSDTSAVSGIPIKTGYRAPPTQVGYETPKPVGELLVSWSLRRFQLQSSTLEASSVYYV